MDIEKLIRRLRNDADAYRNGKTLGRAFADQEDVLDNAATALSTLYAKYKSRDSLVDSLEDDVARLTEENEMLKEALKKYEVF